MAMPRAIVPGPAVRRSHAFAVRASAGVLVPAALALVTAMEARAADAPSTPDDRAISVGCWAVASAEWDGTPVDQETLSRLQVVFRADGSWAVLLRSIPLAEGRSTNQQDRNPKTFDMETLGSEGIEPRRYRGIYRLDGDSRVLCIVPAGKPLPDEFSAPRHSDRMLVTLTRLKQPCVRE